MDLPTGKFQPVHFSTGEASHLAALTSWREVCGRELMKVDMEPLGDAPFRCAASLRALPGLGIASISSSPNRLTRTRAMASDGNDDFFLVSPTSGTTVISAHGREVTLGPGDATVIAAADPNQSLIPTPGSFLTLAIPAAVLTSAVVDLDDMLTGFIPAASDALQLLLGYVSAVRDDMELSAPGTRRHVVTHIHDLVTLAIGVGRDARALANGRGRQAARLRAIKADILENLGEHGLSVEGLAAKHHISARYIRRLFEEDDLTFTDFVLTQRLKQAHRRLQEPRYSDQAISLIAFDIGFNDLSYFNRTFRRHFGMTPSDVRREARAMEDPF